MIVESKHKKILEIIKPLFDYYNELIIPANEQEINDFLTLARKNNVPKPAINELLKFYKVSNGIPCLDSLTIHEISDDILYEFWNDSQLWIG